LQKDFIQASFIFQKKSSFYDLKNNSFAFPLVHYLVQSFIYFKHRREVGDLELIELVGLLVQFGEFFKPRVFTPRVLDNKC